MPAAYPTLIECFSDLPDPRVERTRAHKLIDILVIAICAVICGAEGWDDMVVFAKAKREWLDERLELPNGIPSADTFRRVLARLDPKALQACFLKWTQGIHKLTEGEVISCDGKTLRHSFDNASGMAAIHMVSVWATRARLVLGQVKVEEKSNEIPAVPALLALLDIKGCIVTTDAMSCQRATAAQIITQGADYVLAVKDNQPTLSAAIQSRFTYLDEHPFEKEVVDFKVCTLHDKGHGRFETRQCELITLQAKDPFWCDIQKEWAGLRSLARITCTRQIGDKTTQEVRYFINSIHGDAKQVLRAVRQHWGIENSLHYVLDVSMDEDACRIRKDNGADTFAVLRHVALNLLSQEKTCKRGIKARQKQAGWDNDYLSKVLIS
jgi:predicted transposase YbfD/YdcC